MSINFRKLLIMDFCFEEMSRVLRIPLTQSANIIKTKLSAFLDSQKIKFFLIFNKLRRRFLLIIIDLVLCCFFNLFL